MCLSGIRTIGVGRLFSVSCGFKGRVAGMNTTYPYLCFKSKLKVFFLLARVELVLELALGRLQLGIRLVAEIVDNDLVGEL